MPVHTSARNAGYRHAQWFRANGLRHEKARGRVRACSLAIDIYTADMRRCDGPRLTLLVACAGRPLWTTLRCDDGVAALSAAAVR